MNELPQNTTPATQQKVGVLIAYTTLVISTFVSLLYTPFMLRSLGQSEYGIYQLVGSIANYLSLLSLGLTGSYVRFYTIYNKEDPANGTKKLNGIYITIYVAIALIATVIGMAFLFNFQVLFGESLTKEELLIAKKLMGLMTVNAAISLLRVVFTSNIIAQEKFIFQKALTLFHSLSHPLLCILILVGGGKAVALGIITVLCALILFIVEMVYCKTKLHFEATLGRLKKNELITIFTFSSFILINDIINEVNWSIDKVILGALVGSTAIAVYGLASQLNTYYLTISTTIASVFFPRINKIVLNNSDEAIKRDEINRLFIKVGRMQGIVTFLVMTGYVFFGKQFISLWAGSEYIESYYVGLWLMIPVTIPLTQNLGIEIQRAYNKQKVRTITYAGMAILNVAFSIPLAIRFGAVGCAIGTGISLVLGNIVFMNWYYHKHLYINIVAFWKEMLHLALALIIPCIVGIVANCFITFSSYLTLGLGILVYIVIYFISMWLIGFNSSEKRLVIGSVKKFSSHFRGAK